MTEGVGHVDAVGIGLRRIVDQAVQVIALRGIEFLAQLQVGQRHLVQRIEPFAVVECQRGAVGAEGQRHHHALVALAVGARDGAKRFAVAVAVQQHRLAAFVIVAITDPHLALPVGIPVPYVALPIGHQLGPSGRQIRLEHRRIDLVHRLDAGLLGEQDARAAVLGGPQDLVGADAGAAPVDLLAAAQVRRHAQHAGDVHLLAIDRVLCADAHRQPLVADPAPPVDVHLVADPHRLGGFGVAQRHDDQILLALDRHLGGDVRPVRRQFRTFHRRQLGEHVDRHRAIVRRGFLHDRAGPRHQQGQCIDSRLHVFPPSARPLPLGRTEGTENINAASPGKGGAAPPPRFTPRPAPPATAARRCW
ncbi:hypothetical protein [uncultured Sphingomonas sp.]|uniref:hypothetical protein n=1 Tax=uncultured Sphingomonas sp. TaxID=158754 RepID=UPI0026360F3D|nr:hypothetical protein [uncultured Sphingomonas sp.]